MSAADVAFTKFLLSVTESEVLADRRPKLSSPELWMLWNLEEGYATATYLQWRLWQIKTAATERAA